MHSFFKISIWKIWILTAVLCTFGMEILKVETAAASDKLSEATDHLVTVLENYLQTAESMYASQRWAFAYVDAYLNSKDWKDLEKARMACIVSSRYLADLSMPDDDLTAEEYTTLASGGVDTAYLSEEFQTLPLEIREVHIKMREIVLEYLEENIFWEKDVEILKEELVYAEDDSMYMSRYICFMVNYMLLQLGKEERWDSMAEKYPVLFRECSEWIDKEEDVMKSADSMINEIEKQEYRRDKIRAMLDAKEYDWNRIDQNNDLEMLKLQMHQMTSLPTLLPLPVWYDSQPDVTGYISYYITEDGDVIYPQSGDDLDGSRHESFGIYMQIQGVSKDDVVSYLETAKDAAELISQEEETEWFIKMPDYAVNMKWEDDMVTITFKGEDVTFAPSWYIDLNM